jgi:hypothetical protein
VRIEHGPAALGSEIKRILREIIFSGDELRSGAGDIKRRNVIDGVRPSIRGKERKPVTEAFSQARFQGVIAGVRDAGNFTDRGVDAIVRVHQSASRIEAPLVHVIFGGNRTWARHRTASAGRVDARDKDWRIAFNESRQPDSGGAHVSDLKEPVRADRVLNIQIPILGVGQMQIAGNHQQCHRLGESLTERIRRIKRIGK